MAEGLHRDALDALGDPTRRAIIEILSSGGHSVQQVADELPISRPAVSRHLRLLKEAGLVSDRADGTRRIYQLRDEGVEAIREYFAQIWDQAVARSSSSSRTRATRLGAARRGRAQQGPDRASGASSRFS